MEFLVVCLVVLAALIVTAAVMDLRARRSRRRITVDSAGAVDARRTNDARADLYSLGHDAGPGFTGGGF